MHRQQDAYRATKNVVGTPRNLPMSSKTYIAVALLKLADPHALRPNAQPRWSRKESRRMFDTNPQESAGPALPRPFFYPQAASKPNSSTIDADENRFGCLYGASPAMREVFHLIAKVAPSDISVLIVGESGCGKELAAQMIHDLSPRADGPFVPLNCGALPATLIEAELFGYEKGAFTGANRTHSGFFERAEGGTLFLDEITEMSVDMQVRLLRVLESGSLVRVGGNREIACQVRVLAATNRDPMEAVRDGVLREDLLYRLAVFPLVLPPLRQRGDDVLLLANRFIEELNEQYENNKHLTESAEEVLRQHHWPGNVRELRNCIQRAYILAEGVDEVEIDTVMPLGQCERARSSDVLEFEIGTSLAEAERQIIFATLDQLQGNKRRTAEVLGVSLKTLYNRLNEYSEADVLPECYSAAPGRNIA